VEGGGHGERKWGRWSRKSGGVVCRGKGGGGGGRRKREEGAEEKGWDGWSGREGKRRGVVIGGRCEKFGGDS